MIKRFLPIALVAFILILLPFTLVESWRNVAIQAVSPITTRADAVRRATGNFFTNLGQISGLRTEKEALQNEILDLRRQVSELEDVQRENEALRKELGVTGTVHDTDKAFAHIVLQTNNPLDRSFVIDVGTKEGIKVGQPVVNQGFLIGRIVSVRADSAVVRSIVSPKSIIQAWIPGLNQKGVITGDGNTANLIEIDQGAQIDIGQNVETSGLAGANSTSIPAGILIGKVASNTSAPSSLKQSFRITLGVDPSTLEEVMVLLIDTL